MVGNNAKWAVEQGPDGLSYCKRDAVGEDRGTASSARTEVFHPDFDGGDVQLIADFCRRFGYSIRSIVDECRRTESKAAATNECERLNSAEDTDGDK